MNLTEMFFSAYLTFSNALITECLTVKTWTVLLGHLSWSKSKISTNGGTNKHHVLNVLNVKSFVNMTDEGNESPSRYASSPNFCRKIMIIFVQDLRIIWLPCSSPNVSSIIAIFGCVFIIFQEICNVILKYRFQFMDFNWFEAATELY